MQAGWGGAYGQRAYLNSFAPTTPLNITATADLYDPFQCWESGGDQGPCVIYDAGVVSCSQAGFLYDESGATSPPFEMEEAFTLFYAQGHTVYGKLWKYTVVDDCSNTYSPDFDSSMLNPPNTVSYRPYRQAFFMSDYMVNYGFGWSPLPGQSPQFVEDYTVAPSASVCTYNP